MTGVGLLKIGTAAMRICIAVVVLGLVGEPAAAQTYPTRAVRLVVPYAPGGVVDYTGRLVAKLMGDRLGQQMVVDNRPGAGGVIGTENVVHAPPDGYNLLIMDPAIVINPELMKSVPYEIAKDLQTVSVLGSSPLVLVVPTASVVQDVPGLIAYAKANPGRLNFGSAGVGTTPHMAGELLKLSTGIEITHVAYKGMGPAVSDLVAGQIEMSFSSITAALPFITDGKLRGLATTGTTRSSALPDLPTVAEAGVPGFAVDLWLGLFAPVNMPPDLLARLNQEVRAVLAMPQLRDGLARVGVEPRPSSPAEGDAFVQSEFAKWSKVIQAAHIQAN